MTSAADWKRLCNRIEGALRKLPLRRAGFEDRTRDTDWAILDLWPIGDDLEPVISQRAEDIAFSMMKNREFGPRREVPRPHTRDVLAMIGRHYRALARQLGPEAHWRSLLFSLRCEVKRTRLRLHRVAKREIVEQLADVYFELTGQEPPGFSYNGRPTRFEQLGDSIFDGEPWRSTGKEVWHARYSKKVGNKRPPT
jgi:hypothetical protein